MSLPKKENGEYTTLNCVLGLLIPEKVGTVKSFL